jgi:hypothetical protein
VIEIEREKGDLVIASARTGCAGLSEVKLTVRAGAMP